MKLNIKCLSIFTFPALIMLGSCNNQSAENNNTADTLNTDNTTNQVQESRAVTLKVRSADQIGEYLVDDQGRSLYLFKADSQNAQSSTCYESCAKAWPPLIAEQKPEAGNGIDESLITTFKRNDGKMQVAYNGWPLYYYVKDQQAGQRTGQDIEDHGAEWYLLTPDGKEAHKEGHEEH